MSSSTDPKTTKDGTAGNGAIVFAQEFRALLTYFETSDGPETHRKSLVGLGLLNMSTIARSMGVCVCGVWRE